MVNPIRTESTAFLPRNMYEDYVYYRKEGIVDEQELIRKIGCTVDELRRFHFKYMVESSPESMQTELFMDEEVDG